MNEKITFQVNRRKSHKFLNGKYLLLLHNTYMPEKLTKIGDGKNERSSYDIKKVI